jgi:hypothetical protein
LIVSDGRIFFLFGREMRGGKTNTKNTRFYYFLVNTTKTIWDTFPHVLLRIVIGRCVSLSFYYYYYSIY